MSLTVRVLLGLVLGLLAGFGVGAAGVDFLNDLVGWIEPLGRMWVNAIRMTVIPLVGSLLVVGVVGTDVRAVGRIGGRAIGLFLALIAFAAVLTALVTPPLVGRLPVDAAAAESLRESLAGAGQAESQVQSIGEWLVSLIPTNPMEAMADGAMLPFIIFTLLFSLAAARIAADHKEAIVGLFKAISEAMLVLIGWILDLAPIGVFALALSLGANMGLNAAGAILAYIIIHSGLCIILLGVVYPLAVVGGRLPLKEFSGASLPAQAVAFSSRSSLASLPPAVEEAENRLKLPAAINSFLLPLGFSVFRITAPVPMIVGAYFIAYFYGITLEPLQLLTMVATSLLASFTVPGVPGGGVIAAVPVLMAVDLPVEGIGILLAVDTIPDIFRTTANVTANIGAAVVLARGEEKSDRNGKSPPSEPT
ncbi:MAG: dicarboxylate/amino acid:cation symporter [Gemmatimonadota bacterium]|jgi:Na+/H+-dicarboxylate symporter